MKTLFVALLILSASAQATAANFFSCDGTSADDTDWTVRINANLVTPNYMTTFFAVSMDREQTNAPAYRFGRLSADKNYRPHNPAYSDFNRFLLARGGWSNVYLLLPKTFNDKVFTAYWMDAGHSGRGTIRLRCEFH